MSVRRVKAMAAGVTCAGVLALGTVALPPELLGVAWADDDGGGDALPGADDITPGAEGAAPAVVEEVQPPLEPLAAEMPGPVPGDTTTAVVPAAAPAGVPAGVLVAGMDPASLTVNPDGSLVYHGTTPVGVDTPGWSAIASKDGIVMIHGPVAPAPPADLLP